MAVYTIISPAQRVAFPIFLSLRYGSATVSMSCFMSWTVTLALSGTRPLWSRIRQHGKPGRALRSGRRLSAKVGKGCLHPTGEHEPGQLPGSFLQAPAVPVVGVQDFGAGFVGVDGDGSWKHKQEEASTCSRQHLPHFLLSAQRELPQEADHQSHSRTANAFDVPRPCQRELTYGLSHGAPCCLAQAPLLRHM